LIWNTITMLMLKCKKEEARDEGRAEGLMYGIKSSILNLMHNMKMNAADAINVLGVPLSEQPKYAAMLQ